MIKPTQAKEAPVRYVIGKPGEFLPHFGICFDNQKIATAHAIKHGLYVLSFGLCARRNPAAMEKLKLVTTLPVTKK